MREDDLNVIFSYIDRHIEVPKYENDGHGMDHISRVVDKALYLQAIEGGDKYTVAVAAYLHDVHRWIAKDGNYVAPRDCLRQIDSIVSHIGLTEKQKAEVLYAIEHHDDIVYNIGEQKKDHIETCIIQDADKLDAIGAIGVGRAFMYGASHRIPNYLPSVPMYRRTNKEGENDISVIHHIYNRLIHLDEQLITETAKRMAKDRIEFMKVFLQCFLNEWD